MSDAAILYEAGGVRVTRDALSYRRTTVALSDITDLRAKWQNEAILAGALGALFGVMNLARYAVDVAAPPSTLFVALALLAVACGGFGFAILGRPATHIVQTKARNRWRTVAKAHGADQAQSILDAIVRIKDGKG